MSERVSLLRSAGSISLATAMSRVLGLVREQVQSYYFGAGFVTDAFLAAFRIPNLLRDLFAEGALSSAFVPTFTAIKEHDGQRGGVAPRRTGSSRSLAVILTAVTLGIFLFAPWIMRVYAAGFTPDKLELAVTMTRILAPFLWRSPSPSVAMGILNTYGTLLHARAGSGAPQRRGDPRASSSSSPVFVHLGWPAGCRWRSARWWAACCSSASRFRRCASSASASGPTGLPATRPRPHRLADAPGDDRPGRDRRSTSRRHVARVALRERPHHLALAGVPAHPASDRTVRRRASAWPIWRASRATPRRRP